MCCGVAYPKMSLVSGADDPDAPDAFTERSLEARLLRTWASIVPPKKVDKSAYDPYVVEEQYEKLRREYVLTLQPAFKLDEPDTKWDRMLPMLVRQRQLLRISVFTLLCQLFRPLLTLKADQVEAMPQYKRDLLFAQRNHLTNAATSLLESVACLHDNMGGNQTKFFLLSFCTFEPAMLLGMHLLGFETSLGLFAQAPESDVSKDPQRNRVAFPTATRKAPVGGLDMERCRMHIKTALRRLNMLCEVSVIASIGAHYLGQLHIRLNSSVEGFRTSDGEIECLGDDYSDSLEQEKALWLGNHEGSRDNAWIGSDVQQSNRHSNETKATLSASSPPFSGSTLWAKEVSEDSLKGLSTLDIDMPWLPLQSTDSFELWSPHGFNTVIDIDKRMRHEGSVEETYPRTMLDRSQAGYPSLRQLESPSKTGLSFERASRDVSSGSQHQEQLGLPDELIGAQDSWVTYLHAPADF